MSHVDPCGRLTPQLAAQYADMVNFGPHPFVGGVATLDAVQAKIDVLRENCSDDRPYDSILRSHYALPLVVGVTNEAAMAKLNASGPPRQGTEVAGSVGEITEYYQNLIQAGMQYFIVCPRPDDGETLRLLAQEVIPALKATA